jgi:cell division protein ZapB
MAHDSLTVAGAAQVLNEILTCFPFNPNARKASRHHELAVLYTSCPRGDRAYLHGLRGYLTNQGFYNYIVAMEKDLDALSAKVAEMVKIVAKLRDENLQLRQQLAAKSDENTRLSEKISAATTRLEAVLAKIPEKET